MAVQKVKKIVFFGMGSREKESLKELQKTGFLQIIGINTKEAFRAKDEVTSLIHKADLILSLLEKKLGESMFEKMKPVYVSESAFFSEQEKDYESNRIFVESIWDLMRQKEEFQTAVDERKNRLKELLPWRKMNLSFADLEQSFYTRTVLGKMPSRFYEEAKDTVLSSVETDLLHEDSEIVYLSVTFLKKEGNSLLDSLKNYGFEEYIPSFQCANIAEEYSKIEKEITEFQSKIQKAEQALDEYQTAVSRLRLFYDYLVNLKEKRDVESQAVSRGTYTFSFYAWIAEKNLKKLDALLEKKPELSYEEVPLEKGEVAPVFLDNKSFAEPFEFVTGMYSYPQTGEVDPTPFLAPFFAVFLAFCLLDAGYSLVLLGVSLFALKKFRLGDSMKKLMKILRISGTMGVIVGILTGGYFGMDLNVLPEGVSHFIKSFRILEVDPTKTESLYVLLSICLGMGYVHVLTGFIISFVYKLRDKAYSEAVLDVFPWIMMIVGVAGVIEKPLSGQMTWLGKSLVGVALLGAAIILFFGGRESKNPVVRFFNGLYKLYGVSGIFGDVLSYARLFALGLSGSIIAGVINTLSSKLLMIDFSNIGGIIVSVLTIILFLVILIGGHIFMILMGALGAFIHTMRLQFVEFFGKFFQGGGELFSPFKLKMKYFAIKNKNNE